MPHIIPIRDLKNTTEISALCASSEEPIFVTKNGYGDMVFMSMAVYEKTMLMQEVYSKLAVAEQELSEGKTRDSRASLVELRKKYGI